MGGSDCKAVTYDWVVTDWDPLVCPTNCDYAGGNQTRTVTCTGSDGTVDGTKAECNGTPEPANTNACAAQPACVTYSWDDSAPWLPVDCDDSCGLSASDKTRVVDCVGTDGSTGNTESLCINDDGAKPATVDAGACAGTAQCGGTCNTEGDLGADMTALISDLRGDVGALTSSLGSLEEALEDSMIVVQEPTRPECWARESGYDTFFNGVLAEVNKIGTSFTDDYSLCILDYDSGVKAGTKEWAIVDTTDNDKVYPTCVQMTLASTGGGPCHSEYECGHSSYDGLGTIGFKKQQSDKLKAVFQRMPSLKHWLCPEIQDECIHISFTGADDLGYPALATEVGATMDSSPVSTIDGYPLVDFFCVGKDELVKVRNKQFGLVPACLTWQTNKGAGQGTIPQYTCEGGVPAHGANWDDWQAAGYTERSR
eukprot:UN22535